MANDAQWIELGDGAAAAMGDGTYVVCQRDERGVAQSVVITIADMQRMAEAVGTA